MSMIQCREGDLCVVTGGGGGGVRGDGYVTIYKYSYYYYAPFSQALSDVVLY